MANTDSGAPSGAPTRLRGIKGWQTGVIQADGQRWVTFTLEWIDDDIEPVAVTFAPRDAEMIAKTLFHYGSLAATRDIGDSN